MPFYDFFARKFLDSLFSYSARYTKRLYRGSFRKRYDTTSDAGENDLALFQPLLDDLLHYAGGRKEELNTVLELTAQKRTGFILVEGPSGFGKTTFISQVKRNLEEKGERHIWHLFSRTFYGDASGDAQRFDKNIAEQIAWFKGIDPRDIGNKSSFIAKSMKSLSHMVILVDALDETDSAFLRSRLPKTARGDSLIILTARATGDDRHFSSAGFRRDEAVVTIEIPPLALEDIFDLMERLRLPGSSAHSVAKISNGDPFYVRFLLEDLIEGRLDLDQIYQQPPSLSDYLELQFQQLAGGATLEAQAQIISHIVFSPIPIPKSELISTIGPLTNLNFDRTFDPIKRFFIATESGYVVCHNRFKHFFVERLGGYHP